MAKENKNPFVNLLIAFVLIVAVGAAWRWYSNSVTMAPPAIEAVESVE